MVVLPDCTPPPVFVFVLHSEAICVTDLNSALLPRLLLFVIHAILDSKMTKTMQPETSYPGLRFATIAIYRIVQCHNYK